MTDTEGSRYCKKPMYNTKGHIYVGRHKQLRIWLSCHGSYVRQCLLSHDICLQRGKLHSRWMEQKRGSATMTSFHFVFLSFILIVFTTSCESTAHCCCTSNRVTIRIKRTKQSATWPPFFSCSFTFHTYSISQNCESTPCCTSTVLTIWIERLKQSVKMISSLCCYFTFYLWCSQAQWSTWLSSTGNHSTCNQSRRESKQWALKWRSSRILLCVWVP